MHMRSNHGCVDRGRTGIPLLSFFICRFSAAFTDLDFFFLLCSSSSFIASSSSSDSESSTGNGFLICLVILCRFFVSTCASSSPDSASVSDLLSLSLLSSSSSSMSSPSSFICSCRRTNTCPHGFTSRELVLPRFFERGSQVSLHHFCTWKDTPPAGSAAFSGFLTFLGGSSRSRSTRANPRRCFLCTPFRPMLMMFTNTLNSLSRERPLNGGGTVTSSGSSFWFHTT
mmetsp:Transcript_16825/g.57487  ORF Transcript_16825/g.57487 Transcript_16825/m.57487 type:complete len:228 (-) Transcript_16825:1470-2153(-)